MGKRVAGAMAFAIAGAIARRIGASDGQAKPLKYVPCWRGLSCLVLMSFMRGQLRAHARESGWLSAHE
jgi:hypothetical protein